MLTFSTAPQSTLHLDTSTAPHHLKPYKTHPITLKLAFPPPSVTSHNTANPTSPSAAPRRHSFFENPAEHAGGRNDASMSVANERKEMFKTELFRVKSRDKEGEGRRVDEEIERLEGVEFVLTGRVWVVFDQIHFLLSPSHHPHANATRLHSPPQSPTGAAGGGRRLSLTSFFSRPAKPTSGSPPDGDPLELEDDSDEEGMPGVRRVRMKRSSVSGAASGPGGATLERSKSRGDGWPLVIDHQPLTHLSFPVDSLLPPTTLVLHPSKALSASSSSPTSHSFLGTARSPAQVVMTLPSGSVPGKVSGARLEFVFSEVLSGDSEAEVLIDHLQLAIERARGQSGLTAEGQL